MAGPAKSTSRTPEAGDSRSRLLAAAKMLMAAEGYERVSTAAIARAAGSSESQLIRYFGSKAGLLESVINEGWATLNPEIARLTASSPNAHDAIIATLAMATEALSKDRELAKLLLFESRRMRGADAEIRVTTGFLEFARQVLKIIEWGQKDGTFNPWLKSQAIASALLGACEGMIRDRMLVTPAPFPEGQIRAVFAAIITGLR